MRIREAVMEDCAQMDRLLTELIHEEARFDANLDPAFVVSGNYAARICEEGHKAFVAEAEGELVGFVYGFLYRIPEVCFRPIAVLDALYVAGDHRRRGIARELIGAFRQFAAEGGAESVELKVFSANEDALRLYEALGFHETKKYLSLRL